MQNLKRIVQVGCETYIGIKKRMEGPMAGGPTHPGPMLPLLEYLVFIRKILFVAN